MSNVSPLRREMSTSDWTFVLALPDSERSFRMATAVGEYCVGDESRGYRDWGDYESRFLSHFERRIVPLEKAAGLRIIRAATLRKYAKELEGQRGVILFSHCNRAKQKIEFADGMQEYKMIARKVSTSFEGIADVSACRPNGLELILKTRAPRCAVKIVGKNLDPAMWFLFYAYFLLQFAKNRRSYAEALLATTSAFAGRAAV